MIAPGVSGSALESVLCQDVPIFCFPTTLTFGGRSQCLAACPVAGSPFPCVATPKVDSGSGQPFREQRSLHSPAAEATSPPARGVAKASGFLQHTRPGFCCLRTSGMGPALPMASPLRL